MPDHLIAGGSMVIMMVTLYRRRNTLFHILTSLLPNCCAYFSLSFDSKHGDGVCTHFHVINIMMLGTDSFHHIITLIMMFNDNTPGYIFLITVCFKSWNANLLMALNIVQLTLVMTRSLSDHTRAMKLHSNLVSRERRSWSISRPGHWSVCCVLSVALRSLALLDMARLRLAILSLIRELMVNKWCHLKLASSCNQWKSADYENLSKEVLEIVDIQILGSSVF